ncbi:MAG: hypothetical protein CMP10_15155 [Zetaproteobacteria bacterium]|nr:hypothetical protein [Pseudobdellovibrionaceae bacterium]
MNEYNHSTCGLILAAGKGTRMKSTTPKVLHKVMGIPILERVYQTLSRSGVDQICLVLSEDTASLENFLCNHPETTVCIQKNRLGTGDAAAAAAKAFLDIEPPKWSAGELVKGQPISSEYILVFFGDTPAISAETIKVFLEHSFLKSADIAILGMEHPNPHGYGRLVTDDNGFLSRIVEEKDADANTKKITLCNSGIMLAKTELLFSLLQDLTPENAQKEYYLTDCFELAAQRNIPTCVFVSEDYQSFSGVNDRSQLAEIETYLVRKKIESTQKSGVTFHLPETTWIDESVVIGTDSEIGSHCILQGNTKIGKNCIIGSRCTIINCSIPDNTILENNRSYNQNDFN